MDLDCDRPPPPSADMKSSDSDASELLREFLRKRDMIYLSSRVDYSRRRSARLVVGFNAISIEGKCTSFLFFANDYLSLSGLGFPKEELIFLKKSQISLLLSRRNSAKRERDLRW